MTTRSRSLTFRLTLLFALASVLVLFLLGLLIGGSLERHFEEQDSEVLSGKMELVLRILDRASGDSLSGPLTGQLDDALVGHHGLAVVVYRQPGQALYTHQTAVFAEPQWLAVSADALARPVKWTTGEGVPMRGLSRTWPAVGDGQPAFLVNIATDIVHHEQFLTGFRQTLWTFMALATVVMGLLGWFVVRRGLSPLQLIKCQAAEITAKRLHTRLPTEAIPRELADLAETLNHMLSRLEESFQRLSDFSSDLAHELRTPVSNLLTQTQVTLARKRSADEYCDILGSNAEELERLARMIADMLFLAKADHHQILPQREAVNLGDEVRDLLAYYGILAEDKRLQVSLSGSASVAGDRLMLRRALSNLLSNAIRHTPEGGRIAVGIERDLCSTVKLTVENSGPTLPPEQLPRVFDRFFRADSSRQRTTEGSGLGLAITRSILRAHGGDVRVTSADELTQFTLTLPDRRDGSAGT